MGIKLLQKKPLCLPVKLGSLAKAPAPTGPPNIDEGGIPGSWLAWVVSEPFPALSNPTKTEETEQK